METVAELKHFYFAYKKNNLVLHDIDFKIEKGSFTVIAGPSGSGKTTLSRLSWRYSSAQRAGAGGRHRHCRYGARRFGR